jgi:hypothetical protein
MQFRSVPQEDTRSLEGTVIHTIKGRGFHVLSLSLLLLRLQFRRSVEFVQGDILQPRFALENADTFVNIVNHTANEGSGASATEVVLGKGATRTVNAVVSRPRGS